MQIATRITVKFFMRKYFTQHSPESCCELQPHRRKFFHSQPPGKQHKTRGDLFARNPGFVLLTRGRPVKNHTFALFFCFGL